jgi:hypothetical protein
VLIIAARQIHIVKVIISLIWVQQPVTIMREFSTPIVVIVEMAWLKAAKAVTAVILTD